MPESNNEMELPRGWLAKITMREVFAVIVFCVGIGTWIQTQRQITTDLERRVAKLEDRLDQKDRSDTAADKVINLLEYRLGEIDRRLSSIETNVKKMAQ